MFCSEFYIAALQYIKKLPEKIDPSEQTPEDVVKMGFLASPISLTG
jgi:hypothetical protein